MKPTTENNKYKPLKNLSCYVYIVFIVRVIKLLLWVLEAMFIEEKPTTGNPKISVQNSLNRFQIF